MSVNDGYEYMSERPDGRVVLGGMRYLVESKDVGESDDTASNLNQDVSTALREYMKRMINVPVKVQHEWAGIMGFTRDGFPLVGELAGIVDGCNAKGEFILAGFTGHGMSRCFLTAEAVAHLVVGQSVPKAFPEVFLLSKERLARSMDSVGKGEPPLRYDFA
ncbi:hypothetical protein HDU79_001073 [Rhizoclosmatium sp. JEL0117]|nr:hypothetical protein HDU79_001073 [Rhizoclosmatium sp. JEL0117]